MTERLTADELAALYGVPAWAARLATDDDAQRARQERRQALADAYGVPVAYIHLEDDERTDTDAIG